MIDSDERPYPVGKYKPPQEHQFKPGNVPRGHRRKGQVSLLSRLRRKLDEQLPGQERTIADALVTKIAAEALRSPIRYWPILRALERPEPPTPTSTGDGVGPEPEAADDPAVAPDDPEDGLEPVVWGGRGPAEPAGPGQGGASGAPVGRS